MSDERPVKVSSQPIPPCTALRGLRARENLTQKQMCSRLNIKQGYLSMLERGLRPIPSYVIDKICTEFIVTREVFELSPRRRKEKPHHD